MKPSFSTIGVSAPVLAALAASLAFAQTEAPKAPLPQPVPVAGSSSNRAMAKPVVTPTANGATPVTMDDKKFLRHAAVAGTADSQLGQLAAQKSSNDAVRQLGQKVVDDHSKTNSALTQLGSAENIGSLPAIDHKREKQIAKLSRRSGAAFDKAYLTDQLREQQQNVLDFQMETKMGTDPAVKDFAANTLPLLEDRLTTIKNLQAQTKNAKKHKK